MELMVLKAHRALQGRKACRVHREVLDSRVSQDPRVILVARVYVEYRVLKEWRETQALQARPVHRVLQAVTLLVHLLQDLVIKDPRLTIDCTPAQRGRPLGRIRKSLLT